MSRKTLLPLLLLLAQTITAQIEQYIPERPSPQRLVNDFTGTLSADQKQALEQKLKQYDDTTSNQVAVVIIPTTGDYDISEVAIQLGRTWGVGNAKSNNGVVLLIAKDDRKLFIAPGYGLEGAIPDITARHIIEEQIKPNFRENDFYRGIDYGTDAIMQAAAGEYAVPPGYKDRGQGDDEGLIGVLVVFVLIFLFVIMGARQKARGGSFMSGRGYRNWNGPSTFFPPSSFGSSSGSSGGGFGGFGGGSFGGGGAGGSW
ncbi:MAG: TPM domain-containing protein [Bacteroidetes bacterium]|nr:TPM domain-containing protein [Bacteroidota bacterium]